MPQLSEASIETYYIAVQINNCLKSTTAIKVAIMKNMDDLHYAKEAITCNNQINAFFTVSKDEWNTKEDTGKSLKNALDVRVLRYATWAEATLNSEKIKLVALAIIELCWSEGIRQLVSQ